MSHASSAIFTASREGATRAAAPVDLLGGLATLLAPSLARRLATLLRTADLLDIEVYLVGGVLRDLFLKTRPPSGLREIDLGVVSGMDGLEDAWPFRAGSLRRHERFGTRTWSDGHDRIDLVQARSERYLSPGSLPLVNPGSLEQDLDRRDFSINALAMALTGARRGYVVDRHGGQRDLRDRIVRALHPGSFSDDPTRAFRALRYATRLGFRIDEATRAQMSAARALLPAISGHRIAAELVLALEEARPSSHLTAIDAEGLLRAIHPALSAAAFERLESARGKPLGPNGRDRLALWILAHGPSTAPSLATRLALSGAERDAIVCAAELATLVQASPLATLARATVLAVDRANDRAVELLRLALPVAIESNLAPLFSIRLQPPLLGGEELVAMGYGRGPGLGRALKRLRAEQLAGRINDPAAARAWLLRENAQKEEGAVPPAASHGPD